MDFFSQTNCMVAIYGSIAVSLLLFS